MEKFYCSVLEAIIDAVNKLNGYQDFRYNGPLFSLSDCSVINAYDCIVSYCFLNRYSMVFVLVNATWTELYAIRMCADKGVSIFFHFVSYFIHDPKGHCSVGPWPCSMVCIHFTHIPFIRNERFILKIRFNWLDKYVRRNMPTNMDWSGDWV